MAENEISKNVTDIQTLHHYIYIIIVTVIIIIVAIIIKIMTVIKHCRRQMSPAADDKSSADCVSPLHS